MNNATNLNRIAWVDAFKFLGIWAIYVGHFGSHAGKAYPFVFTYHVPMFFFAAGFFSINASKDSFGRFIRKKTLQLMVPYVFFTVFALIIYALQNDWGPVGIKTALISALFGIRNQVFAGSLWFIPCLYLIIVGDFLVSKLFKLRTFSLLIATGAWIISQTVLPHNPIQQPSWFMNFDSALYYYIYYALGGILFPYINQTPTTWIGRALTTSLTLLAFGVALITYSINGAWFFNKFSGWLPALSTFKLSAPLYYVMLALIIIYLHVALAKLFAHISILGELGRETLIFCGTEDAVKIILTQFFVGLGLKIHLNNPLITVGFALFCLLVSKYTLVKFVNAYFPLAVGKANYAKVDAANNPKPTNEHP